MPEVNPALFSWFRVYLALFLDILQKCCYPEPVAGAGQDWTGSTTLEGWWNVVKNGGKPTGAGAGEKKPELDENILSRRNGNRKPNSKIFRHVYLGAQMGSIRIMNKK